jgi:pimeloyl-ACP methyl ester carboxylesterase
MHALVEPGVRPNREVIMRYNSVLRSAGLCLSTAILVCTATVFGALAAPPDNSKGKPPLLIRDQGNFYVNLEKVTTPYNDTCKQAPCEGAAPFAGGTIEVFDAYVDYQYPHNKSFKYPIIFTHGGGHHGGYYESTPDGREGWRTYFVRNGFDTFVVDDVNRGRSGYDIRSIAAAVWGDIPVSQIDRVNKYSLEMAWTAFRIGPTYLTPYSPTQFPIESFDMYGGNLVPAYREPIETDRNVKAFVALVDKVGPSVLVTWSQSGNFGWLSALQRPDKFKAIVALEGGVPNLSTPANVALYSKIPILFVIGDRDPARAAQAHSAEQILLNAGGKVKALVLPEAGIFGNGHTFVVEKNNLQIADLIIDWLKQNVQ